MPGKLHIGRFNMNWAGIIVALLFGLAHIPTFWTAGWFDGLEQQVCAVGLGVMYAWWLEKSKSIVAPIIAHNSSDLAATLLQWFNIG
jgi:membrane protease YdiL (CAAX protease family)